MDTQLKKGFLEICILRVIEDGDSYGYQMIKNLEPYIIISESTLYPILRRLEEAGELVSYTEEYHNRLRKYYQITQKGVEKLSAFRENMQQIKAVLDFVGTNQPE